MSESGQFSSIAKKILAEVVIFIGKFDRLLGRQRVMA
jgi:hypothetical protein